MTRTDLRIKYKKNTGLRAPDLNPSDVALYEDSAWMYRDTRNYAKWLEDEIVKLANLKNRLLPWEKLDVNPKLIHK
jgi:hypothetical protein